MNLANKITLSRIIVIPIYVILLYIESETFTIIAGGLFILASASDTLDGYIARKYNMITDFGKFADPLADKLLVLSSIIIFVAQGSLPAWTLVIIMARELSITGFRSVAALKNKVLAADSLGKLKTITQLVALSSLHFLSVLPILYYPVYIIYYASVILTILSGLNYFIKNKDVFK